MSIQTPAVLEQLAALLINPIELTPHWLALAETYIQTSIPLLLTTTAVSLSSDFLSRT